jgi:ribosomal-protein-alanine N-acetyltransferase
MRDDIDKIMEVMEVAFDPQWGEAWNRRQISDSLAMPHNHYRLIAENGAEPQDDQSAAGFTLIRVVPGEEELLLIGVQPDLRGKGLGKQLLQQFTQDARSRGAEKIFLEMRANNPAEVLYRSLGFEPIGRREQYYTAKDGVRLDAITFSLKL